MCAIKTSLSFLNEVLTFPENKSARATSTSI